VAPLPNPLQLHRCESLREAFGRGLYSASRPWQVHAADRRGLDAIVVVRMARHEQDPTASQVAATVAEAPARSY
jgi:hypothetical protein